MPPSSIRSSHSLIRPLVRRLHAYVPGEQPRVAGLIKLNTNENPYPPAPRVLAAIRTATDERLRLYPNPTAEKLRSKLAQLHNCHPNNIVAGNGSDELLALATRAFVEPLRIGTDPATPRARLSRSTVQYFAPSYSLYPVLADIHGARRNPVPLGPAFSLPSVQQLRRGATWDFEAALTYVTTPNAPSGRGYATADLDRLCRAQRGIVILDEAYVDFAEDHALSLALKYPHVIVTRTFSKAYSLCFLRIGYAIAHPDLIAALDKIRDSYNVNGLGQIAALSTLSALSYYQRNFHRVIRCRDVVANGLAHLGFEVIPSRTNFLLVRPPRFDAAVWYAKLRSHKILVRWFNSPDVRDFLRITIGTDAQMNTFINACKNILVQRRELNRGDDPPILHARA
jgi:histidinol-phosphate aminotransferase